MKTRGKAKPLGEAEFNLINSLADDDLGQSTKDTTLNRSKRLEVICK